MQVAAGPATSRGLKTRAMTLARASDSELRVGVPPVRLENLRVAPCRLAWSSEAERDASARITTAKVPERGSHAGV